MQHYKEAEHALRRALTAIFLYVRFCAVCFSASFQRRDCISKREEFVVIRYEHSCVSQMARGYHKIIGKAHVIGTTASESWIRLYLVSLSF